MDEVKLVLRLIHIFSGVFWAGGAFFLAGFLGPAAAATAPESGKVMIHMLTRTRLITTFVAAAVLSALSGILLYIPASGNFNAAWMTTGTGLSLTIGAAFGLAAALHGGFVIGPTNTRIGQVGTQIAQSGGPPSPELMQEMQQLQAKSARNGRILALLLAIAIVGMSINEAF